MKTETRKLYSTDVCIFLPNTINIDRYNYELYHFKVGPFFETQCIWGVSAELRMPTQKGRVLGLPVVLPGWGDPCANFLESGAVVFWGFGVRCGR